MNNKIRFVDTDYHTLFYLPNEENIILTFSNGETHIRKCVYLDDAHIKVGENIYHIFEFAQIMERNKTSYVPEKPVELPEMCYTVLPSSGELIMLKKNIIGYYKWPYSASDRKTNEREARRGNFNLGVTEQQSAAMLFGSMFGWDKPGARPEYYDFYGKPMWVVSKNN